MTEAPKTPGDYASVAARFAWPVAFVVAVVLILSFLRDRASQPAAPTVTVEHPGPTMIRELKALARLETLALRVEKIVDVKDRQKALMGFVDAADSLLFVASGEVIVGVDLGKLRAEDIRSDDKTGKVEIVLPQPEVFSARFDELRSYVHTRSTDVLAKRNEELEAFARREAIASFEASGRDPANIERARDRADKQLRALARAWGVKELTITWRDPEREGAAPK